MYGVTWDPDLPQYTQATLNVSFSEEELLQMLEYTGMDGVVKCTDQDWAG